MTSEGSCVTEDWSNDTETSAITWINHLLKYIKTRKQLFKCYISQYNRFNFTFD